MMVQQQLTQKVAPRTNPDLKEAVASSGESFLGGSISPILGGKKRDPRSRLKQYRCNFLLKIKVSETPIFLVLRAIFSLLLGYIFGLLWVIFGYFLAFMNTFLVFILKNKNISCLSGYNFL